MPLMVDTRCPECGDVYVDTMLRAKDGDGNWVYPSCRCGATVERVHLQGETGGTHGVVTDSIPGGLYIKNMLCNPDGSPRRFDSMTDLRRAAKEKGAMNYVKHEGGKGSDKSAHTQKFV